MVKKRVNRIFNIFAGKVAIIKTRITQFLTILRAPKMTGGQLPHVNFGALREQNNVKKVVLSLDFYTLIGLLLFSMIFKPFYFNYIIIS